MLHFLIFVATYVSFFCSRGCSYAITAMSSEAGNSSSSADREYNVAHAPIAFNNEILPLTSMLNDGNDDNPHDSDDGRNEEGDGFGASKMEDSEVRMDLTDDLLHMVSIDMHVFRWNETN